MKVLKIDPFNKLVMEFDIENTLEAKQKVIGGLLEVGHYFENGDLCYVHEEGMFASPRAFFYLEGAHQPFANFGLIVGSDDQGNDVEPKTNPIDLMNSIKYFSDLEMTIMANHGLV